MFSLIMCTFLSICQFQVSLDEIEMINFIKVLDFVFTCRQEGYVFDDVCVPVLFVCLQK